MEKNRRHPLRFFALSFLLAVPLSVGMTVLLNLPTNRVVKQWSQPAGVNYKSFDPYHLCVVEGGVEWTNLSFPRRHYLFVGREPDPSTYGHRIDCSFHEGHDDIEGHIARSVVEWTPEGVTFVEASGHRLFIPKKMFVGGR